MKPADDDKLVTVNKTYLTRLRDNLRNAINDADAYQLSRTTATTLDKLLSEIIEP